MLSIESGINYGPANDALLLAAGYLNDLYMMIGNEAWADAANPTIGIGTKDKTYGDIATALFAFKGQLPSLLEEELALLRGRDDFFQPGVRIAPVYNRLIWNYTRGIDAGEVIYALNYNIQENPNTDGKVDAADAARCSPRATATPTAITSPRSRATTRCSSTRTSTGCPASRPSTCSANRCRGLPGRTQIRRRRRRRRRAGRQIFDLTWRKDYEAGPDVGWEHFTVTRVQHRATDSHPPGMGNGPLGRTHRPGRLPELGGGQFHPPDRSIRIRPTRASKRWIEPRFPN
jgi:hypothetical protein